MTVQEQLLLPLDLPLLPLPSPHTGEGGGRQESDVLARHIRQRATFAPLRARQGVCDRRAASLGETGSIGHALIDAAPTDPAALLTIIAALCGVSPALARTIPLDGDDDDDKAHSIRLCLATGTLRTDMDAVFAGAARQRDFLLARPATRILVKPLPRRVVDLLTRHCEAAPAVTTLGEVLPGATVDTRRPLISAPGERLRATYPRFVNGLGPLALDLGISNYVAALLLNQYFLVPKSRLFYADCDAAAIWEGAAILYGALGWDDPVERGDVLPFGSRTRPSRADLAAAYAWYRSAVRDAMPANRTSIAALLRHHNLFVRAAGFVLTVVLGARTSRLVDLTAARLSVATDSFLFRDKRAPHIYVDHAATAGPMVSEQIDRVRAHLHALRRRLDHLGQPPASVLMRYLDRALAGERVPLLAELTPTRQPRALSTQSIYDTLPPAHRIAGNAGRSFWQSAFEADGLCSGDISLYARHTSTGCETNTSTSAQPLAQRRARVIESQERVLAELDIVPITGLSRRAPSVPIRIEPSAKTEYTTSAPGVPRYVKRHTDAARRIHYQPTSDAPAARVRFARLQAELMRETLLLHEGPGFIALALVAFDGVVDADALEPALVALPGAYHCDDGVAIEWSTADGRTERRLLSTMTVLVLSKRGTPDRRVEVAGMAARLREWDPVYAFAEQSAVIRQLIDDATAWYVASVPPVLASHARGDAPLAAVSRSTLARRDAKQAIGGSPSAEHPEAGLVWNAYYNGLAEVDEAVVEQLRALCRPSGKADYLDRQRMLAEARELLPVAAQAGRWSAVLCGWVIHLIACGTRLTPALAASTIDAYVGQTLVPLYRELIALTESDLECVDLEALHARVVIGIEASQLGKVEAALSAFHLYLIDCLDVDAPPRHVDVEPNRAPRAQILWPHEIQRIDGWLSDAARTDRLAAQAHAVFAIACAMPVRAGELATLLMSSVRGDADRLELAIDPPFAAKSPKTLAGRRIVPIAEAGSRATLLAWLARRRKEAAIPTDRLFGDPQDAESLCRWGETLHLVTRCLRAATGEGAVSLHALRHTVVSQRYLALGLADAEQRAFEQVSAWAGHTSASTTFGQYFHLYEFWLRRSLDRMLERLPLGERDFARWSGCALGTVRQRAHRQAMPLAQAGWHVMREAAAGVLLPSVAAGLAFVEPMLQFESKFTPSSFETVESALRDLADGRSVETIALRLDRPVGDIERIVRMLDQFADDCAIRSRRTSSRGSDCDPADQLDRLPCAPDIRRVGQPKYACLRRWLRTTTDGAALRDATRAWQRCLVGRYLALDERHAAFDLLGHLRDAGIRGRQLVICADQSPLDIAPEAGRDIDTTVRRVSVMFGEAPVVRRLRPRAGRPRLHLLLQDERSGRDAGSSAGRSIAGLHALMLAAWIHARMDTGEESL